MTTEERIRKVLGAMRHCLPADLGEKDLGCAGCPYMEAAGKMCDEAEIIGLPGAMVTDIREALEDAGALIAEMRKALADAAERIVGETDCAAEKMSAEMRDAIADAAARMTVKTDGAAEGAAQENKDGEGRK